ncbi:P-loop containing nucleoside triphosphate hydrolase protein [Annulohypoxylon moriforme]|nr:P-loop containing nucleoside triphosphate hydrolase protein [Annulohypoxylon moriforme]
MDSTRLGAIDGYKRIDWYMGERKLSDLPIIPLRFVPDQDDIVRRLEARGLRCAQCYGHKKYDGFAYDAKGRTRRERLQGDVFVDFEEYYHRKRTYEPRLGVLQRTSPDLTEVEEGQGRKMDRFSMDHEVDQQNSDICLASFLLETLPKSREVVIQDPEQLRLMRHHVIAFSFRTRKWVRLEIDFIEDIDKSVEARNSGFDDLVILPKYRRLLVSLVDSHSSSANNERNKIKRDNRPLNQLDLVRGKGLGLIVLLHGPPGTGKTSTAETIAAYTGRPLYSMTCGDIEHNVEQVLEKHTSRADKWGCVLLLDEADVFLMRRDFKDTERNSLVSIFLRTLEYYSGILFLTTNRVGVIDEAFKSRIHIALRYPKVKLPTTLAIWKGCLDRIEKDNEFRDVHVNFDRDELMEFAEEHYHKYHKKNATWNGRQIRNAFQTAIAMGQYERIRKMKKKGFIEEEALATGKDKWRVIQLTKDNLETIAETAQDFDKYMKSVHKFPDVEIAKADQLRDDDFSESSEEEEYVIQKLPVRQRTSRKEGSKKNTSSSKKSGKSVATSSSRTATRSSNQTAKQKDRDSSGSDLPPEEVAQNSSESETTDDDS